MAVGFPTKANWASGDVLTAAQMDDLAATLNTVSDPLGKAAGKNAIINGDFGIWQRGITATPTTGYGFGPDRFQTYSYGASTSTISQQTFTPGTAPVSGYEGQYFCRVVSTNTQMALETRLEDVRTLAGQTATLSFWAKSASGQTLTGKISQYFGTGGSTQVDTTITMPTITTSWARYTITFAIPSVSGKTIGTSSWLGVIWLGAINNAFDIWGVQLEAGSYATNFQTATGTKQGELAACQRYFYQLAAGATNLAIGMGASTATNTLGVSVSFPVTMRTTPSISQTSGTDYFIWERSGGQDSFNSFTIWKANPTNTFMYNNTEIATAVNIPGVVYTNNASATIGFSAEL